MIIKGGKREKTEKCEKREKRKEKREGMWRSWIEEGYGQMMWYDLVNRDVLWYDRGREDRTE